MDIYVYWQLFRRRLPLVIFLTGMGALIGVALALSLPAVFRAQAVLIVESGQIPDELAASTVQTGEIEALEIIRQRILSREILLEMANDLGIYADSPMMGADAKVADLRNRIEIITRGGQVRRAARDATIVTVSFSSETPRLTADTVNAIVTLILQTNVEMRTSVARQTLDFFTQEVDRFEEELSQLSGQILNFQENNLESMPDSLEFRRTRQASLQERLVRLEREQSALQDRRAQFVTLFETTGSLSFGGDQARRPVRQIVRPAEQRLIELRGEYASLSGILSDNNPRMVLLLTQIERAEQEVALLPPIENETGGDAVTQTSLFDIQLADLDAQVAYIEDQKSATEAQMAEIARTIEATPSNAVTLGALERTYANLQEQYNQAVANKARAETGSMIESLSRGQRITVVEQAVAPEAPSSPNRPVIAVGGFAAGLALALGSVILLSVLNRTIRRPEDLEKAMGVEVFATIGYIATQRETLKVNLRRISVSGLILVVLAGGLWFVDQNIQPLAPFVMRLLGSA